MQLENLPSTFTSQMQRILSNAANDFFSSLQTPAPVSIRLNAGKPFKPQFLETQIPWANNAYYLSERPVFTLDPAFHAGAYYVQEASSMILEQVIRQSVDLDEELLVLDLCGAPGGKSTHLLSLINSQSLLISNEVLRNRSKILAENIIKWGKPNCIVTNNDPSHFNSLNIQFDVIVVDAPCSGEGLFRKNPEAVDEWSPEHVRLCAARQKRILNDIWPCLKPGGTLIYATCTYNSSENEENLKWLCEHHEAEEVYLKLKEQWGFIKTEVSGISGFHAYPHQVDGEGFFIAALRKPDGRSKKLKRSKQKLNYATRSEADVASSLMYRTDTSFVKHEDLIIAIPKNWEQEVLEVNSKLSIIHECLPVGFTKGKRIVPHEALAQSVLLDHSKVLRFDMNKETALHYLNKTGFDFSAMSSGWNLVTYEGLGLGWANKIGNRINNYYPKNWRIRMDIES